MQKIVKVKNFFLPFFLFLFLFLYSYLFPRTLVFILGEKSPWTSYLYTYGMGLVLFFLSMAFFFLKPSIDSLQKKIENLWFLALFFGCVFMFCLHGVWIFIAIAYPVKG